MNNVPRTDAEWEAMFAPYDDQTYSDALAFLKPNDIVLDIGAGDLRFANQAAARVEYIFAIEQRAELLQNRVAPNIQVIHADARRVEFPKNISAAILLMRHCRHFSLYREKLKAVRCNKLITNARWGMHVEVIDLRAPPLSFVNLAGGWYACACGSVGFKENITFTHSEITQVKNCPVCFEN
ncbi:MAG: rRNA adenine methyltransferase [Chloroflexota bacterium]|nr:MAG: rRNA adenine methyltransferase [Chloroflexota bacterium]